MNIATFEQMPKQNKYYKKPKDFKRKQSSSNKVPNKVNFPLKIPMIQTLLPPTNLQIFHNYRIE